MLKAQRPYSVKLFPCGCRREVLPNKENSCCSADTFSQERKVPNVQREDS